MITVKYIYRSLVALAVAAISGCSTLPTAQTEARMIVVDGEALLKIKPDTFTLSGALITRNSDQAAGLAELSARLERLRSTLPQLVGLKHIQIDTSDIKLGPVYEPACARENDYQAAALCPVAGRIGLVEFAVRASPADRAGPLLSLVSELGADRVEVSTFYLADEKAWRDKALSAAVDDARVKAAAIASAAGAQIGKLEKVQYGNGFNPSGGASAFSITSMWDEDLQQTITVVPTVDLNIEPAPIEMSANVTVAFGIK